VQAANDKSDAYAAVSHKKDCFAYLPSFRPVTCTFGDPNASVNVALVGNSHAGEWVTPLEVLARRNGWRITTYLASQCAFADVAQTFDTSAHSQSCLGWVHKTTKRLIGGHYDLVVMVNRISVTAVGMNSSQSQAAYQRGYETELKARCPPERHRRARYPGAGALGTRLPRCPSGELLRLQRDAEHVATEGAAHRGDRLDQGSAHHGRRPDGLHMWTDDLCGRGRLGAGLLRRLAPDGDLRPDARPLPRSVPPAGSRPLTGRGQPFTDKRRAYWTKRTSVVRFNAVTSIRC
jgi:hypothetical protein